MSKVLVNLALWPLRAIVGTYTASTLPFYYLYQRPWHRLKLSKSIGITKVKDAKGRIVYSRPPPMTLKHPYYACTSFTQVLNLLDPNKSALGIREVISQKPQVDANGNPIVIDGKQLVKVVLSPEFKWLTVAQVMKKVDAIARTFKQMGIDRGTKVMIYAENGPEWFYCALALTRLNAVVVTLFSTLGDSGVVYGLNQSEARFVITSENLLKRLGQIEKDLQHAEKLIYIPNTIVDQQSKAKLAQRLESLQRLKPISLVEVQKSGEHLPEINYEIADLDELALIMYTSGTTGNPKGVMITHRNFVTTLHNMLKMDEEFGLLVYNMQSFPAYLPMAHLFGYIGNFMLFLGNTRIAFCSPFTLLDSSPAHVQGQVGDLKLIQPEVLFTVPLVLERIVKEIYRKLDARSPISAPIFTYLMDYKIRWTRRGYETPIINRLVCKKINNEFGGKLKIVGVGSAPLHERTQALATAALNIKMVQAYGSTEMSGGSHSMHLDDLSVGRSGHPYATVKFYLKDWPEGGYSNDDKPNPRGEIVVGGISIAQGYYKLPQETQESFYQDEDGTRWFYSGDIGEIYPDGGLKIIDRKKDLTKLANGEFISLGKIESGLRGCKYVENICICSNPYKNAIVALVTPNLKDFHKLAQELDKQHLSLEEMCQDEQFVARVKQSIAKAGRELDFKSKEIPELVHLVKEEWTPENNLLTAAFKLKRKSVYDYYRREIDNLFDKLA